MSLGKDVRGPDIGAALLQNLCAEVEADDVAVSLKFATAKVAKASRSTAGQSAGRPEADPWATAEPGGSSDEPPF